MKNQTIKIDFTAMMYIGIMYTGLVISGWLLMRLTIACFKLPSILNAAAAATELKEQASSTGNYKRLMVRHVNILNMHYTEYSKYIFIISIKYGQDNNI